jgi:hypothetical protein
MKNKIHFELALIKCAAHTDTNIVYDTEDAFHLSCITVICE